MKARVPDGITMESTHISTQLTDIIILWCKKRLYIMVVVLYVYITNIFQPYSTIFETCTTSGLAYIPSQRSSISHRPEIPGNYPISTAVIVIYYCVDIIWIIIFTPNFLNNIYYHEKNHPGEPIYIHIQSLINIILENNLVITTKKRVRLNYHFYQ